MGHTHCDACSKIAQLFNQFGQQLADAGLSDEMAAARSPSGPFHDFVEKTLEEDDEHRFTFKEVEKKLRELKR